MKYPRLDRRGFPRVKPLSIEQEGGQEYSETPLPPPPTPEEPDTVPIYTSRGHHLATLLTHSGAVNGVPQTAITAYSTVKSEMSGNQNTAIKVLKHRYYWNQFENTTAGVYDFSLLGTHLDDCAAMVPARKLTILLALTLDKGLLSTSPNVVPKFMVPTGADKMANVYEGGQWGYEGSISGSGYRVRLSNSQVQIALVNMLKAMGDYLKAHPNYARLDGIAFTELQTSNAATGYTEPDFVESADGLLLAANALRVKMPTKFIYVSVNNPKSTSTRIGIDYIVPLLPAAKIGFGSPNLFPDSQTLWSPKNSNGYQEGCLVKMGYFDGFRIPEVQGQDYQSTNIPGATPAHQPTLAELFDVLVDLGAHACVWTRFGNTNPVTGNKFFEDMYAFLETKKNLAAGGLNDTNPYP